MASVPAKDLLFVKKKVACFAKKYIANRDDLHLLQDFPYDIWEKMGHNNLLGLSLPEKYEGWGGSYLEIAVAAEAMTREGQNIGMVVSWLIHIAVSRFFIVEHGNNFLQEKILKKLASGKNTISLAVSEPGKGSSPKLLETSGYLSDNFYILNGEKTYLTNGPIADLFIVVAVVGKVDNKKKFTAFLVPKSTPGLLVKKPMELDFFRPSPHGGIILSDCMVPLENIIGEYALAYDSMLKPFALLEDSLMLSVFAGSMTGQVYLLSDLIKKDVHKFFDNKKEKLGKLKSIAYTMRIIAYEAASMHDSSYNNVELISLLVLSHDLVKQFQNLFNQIIKTENIKGNSRLALLASDIFQMHSMGKRKTRLRCINLAL